MGTQGLLSREQRKWAEICKIVLFNRYGADWENYASNIADNLFNGDICLKDIKEEFTKGKGKELLDRGTPAKMKAFHSSSALVVNFFQSWRQKSDLHLLTDALGFEDCKSIEFEAQFETGLVVNGKKPKANIDVVMESTNGHHYAIESKFTEIYGCHQSLKEAYINNKELWAGLPNLKKLAKKVVERTKQYYYLDVPQLIKHSLGLHKEYGDNFTLVLLWYKKQDACETQKIEAEIQQFKKAIGDDIKFEAITYQEVFAKLKAKDGEIPSDYLKYLNDRYFHQ